MDDEKVKKNIEWTIRIISKITLLIFLVVFFAASLYSMFSIINKGIVFNKKQDIVLNPDLFGAILSFFSTTVLGILTFRLSKKNNDINIRLFKLEEERDTKETTPYLFVEHLRLHDERKWGENTGITDDVKYLIKQNNEHVDDCKCSIEIGFLNTGNTRIVAKLISIKADDTNLKIDRTKGYKDTLYLSINEERNIFLVVHEKFAESFASSKINKLQFVFEVRNRFNDLFISDVVIINKLISQGDWSTDNPLGNKEHTIDFEYSVKLNK